MDILIKASGDVLNKDDFYVWLLSITNSENHLFILCGGGTSITEALQKQGIQYEFLPTGREIKEEKGRLIAKEILEKQKDLTEKRLRKVGVKAIVFIPVLKLNDKICHINGDAYTTALYPSFDKIYVVTLKGRNKVFLNGFKKIEAIYL